MCCPACSSRPQPRWRPHCGANVGTTHQTTLRAERLQAGLSRVELAHRLGCSTRTVKAWELGQRSMPDATWLAAIEALEMARTDREARNRAVRVGVRELLARA